MATLRDLLEDAAEPEDAAASLLEWIGDRMQAGTCRRSSTRRASCRREPPLRRSGLVIKERAVD